MFACHANDSDSNSDLGVTPFFNFYNSGILEKYLFIDKQNPPILMISVGKLFDPIPMLFQKSLNPEF